MLKKIIVMLVLSLILLANVNTFADGDRSKDFDDRDLANPTIIRLRF